MQEVVCTEVLKLQQADIIYPILHIPWVSPTQVVPKKSRVTIVKNKKEEDMPTRLTIGWRVCIDYRRLNAVTRKDHFWASNLFFSRWLFRIFSNRNCYEEPGGDHLHLALLNLCLQKNAFWPLQYTYHIPKVYAQYFQ